MAWSSFIFKKDKRVWAFVDESGRVVPTSKGLIPTRFQSAEDAKIYHVHPRNLTRDDGTSVELSEEAPPNKGKAKRGSTPAARSTRRGHSSSTDAHITFDVPDELLNYPTPPPGRIEIYTDGACSGNPGPCGLGVVLRWDSHYVEISQYLGRGTNNVGELTAILRALEYVEKHQLPGDIDLYTDSSYSIGMISKGWKAKKNPELIKTLRAAAKRLGARLRIHKVKGHAGHPLNERADDLATGTISV